MYLRAIKNNCMSNSQVIAQGEAKCKFDCYKHNYSLVACKYMPLPTNQIALPMILYPYPYDCHEFQLRLTCQSCYTCIVLYSKGMFI